MPHHDSALGPYVPAVPGQSIPRRPEIIAKVPPHFERIEIEQNNREALRKSGVPYGKVDWMTFEQSAAAADRLPKKR